MKHLVGVTPLLMAALWTTKCDAWIVPSSLRTPYCNHMATATATKTATATTTTTSMAAVPTGGVTTLDGQEIRGPITPMGNTIFVKVKDTLTATIGGILLPDQAKERPTEGLVIASGPGKLHPFTGKRIANPIPHPGDGSPAVSVLYGKFDGRPVEYNGDECQMIRDDDVLLYYTGLTLKYETAIPVRDYVLIALEDKFGDGPLQTKSGVVIASQVMKDAVPCEGVVAKVGEGRMASNGDLTPSPVQPGDVVKFKDYAGNDVMIEGKPYSVVKMVDILCTVNKESVTQEDVMVEESTN